MEQLCVLRLPLGLRLPVFVAVAVVVGSFYVSACVSASASASPLPAVPPAQTFKVILRDGRLTVDAENVSLDNIAERISQEASIPIVLNDDVGSQIRSLHINQVPWVEGLRTVLENCDSFFLYSAEKGQVAKVTAVWVYPAGHGRTLEPVVTRHVVPLSEIQKDLKDPDPQIRIGAVEKMIDRGGRRALNAVLNAVADPSDVVRSETLYAAWAANLQLPEPTLQMLALGDKSPTVRFLALQSLQNSPTAKEIAEHALHDPDSSVQNEARAVLDQLKSQAN